MSVAAKTTKTTASQTQRPGGAIEERRFGDHLQKTQAVFGDPELRFSGSFVIRHIHFHDSGALAQHRARAHSRRKVQPVREWIQAVQTGPSHNAHPAGGVAHARGGKNAQDGGKNEVPDSADERHLAVRVQTATQNHIRVFRHGGLTQRREELRLAGSVGIQEPQQIRVGLSPSLFDGGAVPFVLREDDEIDGVCILAGSFHGTIRGTVADTVISTSVAGEFAQINSRASIDLRIMESMLSSSFSAGIAMSSFMQPLLTSNIIIGWLLWRRHSCATRT